MTYYLAPSLAQLRAQIDARWPDRSKSSDGWIGDASHSARKSDHNPDYADGGVVRAIDVTSSGIDADALIAAVINDPRTNYVIHKGIIRGAEQFKPRKYTGSNPHNHHVHISIKHTRAAEDAGSWNLPIDIQPAAVVKPIKHPTGATKPKAKPDDYANLRVDGDFGPVTVKAVQILMTAIKKYSRAIDGDWGRYSKIAVQNWLKDLGYYKRAVDGSFGKYSVIALQNFLRSKGLYPASRYVIDGDFGPATVKAWQLYLNTQNGR